MLPQRAGAQRGPAPSQSTTETTAAYKQGAWSDPARRQASRAGGCVSADRALSSCSVLRRLCASWGLKGGTDSPAAARQPDGAVAASAGQRTFFPDFRLLSKGTGPCW